MSQDRPKPDQRSAYAHFEIIPTRWADNDAYRHVNNVVYYAYFDTVVNRLLIAGGVLDIGRSQSIGVVVETGCTFFSSIVFPDDVHAGLRVVHLGRSSVRYQVGLFRNQATSASAQGYFVHVYVDRDTNQPTELPDQLRRLLAPLMRPQ